jgi:uncharacterized protein
MDMERRVEDNPQLSRYEILDGDIVAGFVKYRRGRGEIEFTHAEIDPAFEGRGFGSTLARSVLDTARAQNLAVVPSCPFMSGWIGKHPEYADLVPEERRPRFGL